MKIWNGEVCHLQGSSLCVYKCGEPMRKKEYAFPDGLNILQRSKNANSDIKDRTILAELVVGLVENRSRCGSNQQLVTT